MAGDAAGAVVVAVVSRHDRICIDHAAQAVNQAYDVAALASGHLTAQLGVDRTVCVDCEVLGLESV